MKPNALVLALLTAATALPSSAHAADDFCSRAFIYAINQICQLLPNGQAICQPVGLAGPAPGASCDTPNGPQLVQVPLGPPNIQMLPFTPPTFPYVPSPYLPNPYAQNPSTANPFTANSLPANTYPPFPFAPNLFGPNPFAPAASLPPLTKPSVQPPVTAANTKPIVVAEPASPAPAEKPLVKLMPETPPTSNAAIVANTTPPAPAVEAAPKAPEPAKAPAEAAVTPSPTPVVATVIAPLVTVKAPEATLPTPESTTTATTATPATADPEAAAKAEKAIEDALAHFEFDSAELTPLGRAMLDGWLANTPKDAAIRVTGHADRLGPEPYNDKLSMLRAEEIKKYLTEKGKPANRIQILARGESMPLISCAGDANPETKSCLAPNRRAEIAAKPVVKPAAKPIAKPAAKQKAKTTVKSVKHKPAQ